MNYFVKMQLAVVRYLTYCYFFISINYLFYDCNKCRIDDTPLELKHAPEFVHCIAYIKF